MKRNIFLWLFYLLELVFILLCGLPSTKAMISSNMPFMMDMWNGYKGFLDKILEITHLSDVTASLSHGIRLIISAVIFNVAILIVYELVAFIIVAITRRIHNKKLVKNGLNKHELTEDEKAKFAWKLYVKKFSWKGLLSFLIPLALVALFVLVRFDKDICLKDPHQNGFFSIYSSNIEPFIKNVSTDFYSFIRFSSEKYIELMHQIINVLGNLAWIEYVIDVILVFIVFLVWWFFVWLITRIFRRHSAKKRAKRAKAKYIAKMESQELKALKGSEKRISSKAEDIMGEMDDNPMHDEDISTIAHVDKDSGVPIHINEKEADYIDDISTGVVDLGVVTSEDEKELISERIPIFVGEEEIDIKLENEQVLDVVEDYEDEEVEEVEDPFFEKYRPESIDTSYLDDSLLNTQIEVYEDDGEDIDESKFAGIEDFVEKSEEIVVKPSEDNSEEVKVEEIKEPEEDILEEVTPVEEKVEEVLSEEVVNEEVTPTEEKVEETTPVEETPVEETPVEVTEVPAEEVAEVKEEVTPIEEKVVETAPVEVETAPVEEEVVEEPIEKKKIVPIVVKKKEEVVKEEPKKEISPITPIRRVGDEKKKPKAIGPISVNRKYNDENRFKNAKSKYLDVIRNKEDEKKKQEEIKKRQLVRRKKNHDENMG